MAPLQTNLLSSPNAYLTEPPEWTDIFTAHHNLGGVGAVDPDALDEEVKDLGRNQVRLWHLFVVAPCNVGLHHCHPIHCERARLVGADGRGVAHRLTGVQVADQVIVLHHFLKKEESSV